MICRGYCPDGQYPLFLEWRIKMQLLFHQDVPLFCCEQTAFPGVKRVADLVCGDVQKVIGKRPKRSESLNPAPQAVLIGTIGKSGWLRQLSETGRIDLSAIENKWECYLFQLVEQPFPQIGTALVIAGSDKRGTIYGLFHLSELLGVSPLVDWSEALPEKRGKVILTEKDTHISKEPSVRYRGIFLNDEWPALGTWARNRFGGFNAAFYSHVFELILRLKGNYLWPAMWKSCFSLDGPGLDSAALADEMGIVMGTSHHEPCMRAGEEYRLMRGKDSVYGDAWDFRANREGILRFWEDGLKRNKPYDNYITVGMRGEQDTPILGNGAGLSENIALLRDVLQAQNGLIRKWIRPQLDEVKRLFVLFTEVERFYYGDEETPGLMNDPALEGVTLMLTDDNFGNLRSLPTQEMLPHKGGFGLYYHLDFHGGAYAYDWMNTNYLPKMWEQLTTAYDGGIREVWIANIGDICLLEYPLCYFMELAYDMDAWSTKRLNSTGAWTAHWVDQQFGGTFTEENRRVICRLLDAYTLINHNRKPEIMNASVYHPVHFREAENLLEQAARIEKEAAALLEKCPKKALPAFWDLLYYPAAASANHCIMWLCAGRTQFYASQGRMEANRWAERIKARIIKDRNLTAQYHAIGGGRFDGMALSEHIGFTSWCSDGCLYPSMTYVEGANQPRLLAADTLSGRFTIGSRWTGDTLRLDDALRQGVSELRVDLACASREPVSYTLETDCPWLRLSRTNGVTADKDVLMITIDRAILKGRDTGVILVHGSAEARILVEAENRDLSSFPAGCYLEENGMVCMDAGGFTSKQDSMESAFVLLTPYGRTGSAVKVLPPARDVSDAEERPWVEYTFEAKRTGKYTMLLYMAPSNTADMRHRLCFGFQLNGGEIMEINGAEEGFQSLKLNCREWDMCVRNNIRIKQMTVSCTAGINHLRLYGGSPFVAFERIVLYPAEKELPVSYLGPVTSFQCK